MIVRDGAAPFLSRVADLAREFAGVGIGCDVVAFTESEARASRNRGDRFARAVFDEGMQLASRADGSVMPA